MVVPTGSDTAGRRGRRRSRHGLRYPLSEIADAMRYLGEGHARGKNVVTT